MKMNRAGIAVIPLPCAVCCFAQQSMDEEVVWKLEHSYWEDVKALDLASYKELWHQGFVGWVSVSPLYGRIITDWITANTARGLHLQS